MFNKSQPIPFSDFRPIQRIAIRTLKKTKLLKSPLQTIKKFSPRINSTFAEYDESVSTKLRYRSSSVDRPRRASEHHISSSMAINSFEDPSHSLISSAKRELQQGNYSEAVNKFSQVISIKESTEALYNRAICNIGLSRTKEAIVDLLNVIKENTSYSKSAYLQLAKCLQYNNEIEPAIRYLTQAINRFSRFDEGFFIRAQLFLKRKNWEKARIDFKKYLKYSPNDENALLGLASTFEKQNDHLSALKILNDHLSSPKIALHKCKILVNLNQFDVALSVLNNLLTTHQSSEGFFLKGTCHYKLAQYNESALCFEQCIMLDSSNHLIPKAIYSLGALKIREKDYYGAIHTFQRCGAGKVKEQKALELYAEAVVGLMKKEYKEAIKTFSKLIKSREEVIDEYIPNCLCYRAYGYLALGLYEKSIQSLKKASRIVDLDKASTYNNEMSNALMLASRLEFSKSILRLESALKVFPRKTEPLVYKASFLVYNAYEKDPVNDSDLLEGLKLIESAISLRDPESELLFYRSIIRYLLGHFSGSLETIKSCIDKAEDNISEHYILKGLCEASIKQYKDAIQDFSIALQLNDKNFLVYYYRAKCCFLIEDNSMAFTDLQKYISNNIQDPNVHLQAAVLFISVGSYEDALKALETSLNIQYSVKANYLSAKCYVIQNNISMAVVELQKLIKVAGISMASVDLEILKYLKSFVPANEAFVSGLKLWTKWLENQPGEIFDRKYTLWFKAVFEVFSGDFSQALEDFQKILTILHSRDAEIMTADESLTSEEENCEVLYNIALCHLFGNKSQSILILEDLSGILNNKHKGQMLLLASSIHMSLGDTKSAERFLKKAFRCDSDLVNTFLATKTAKLLPLNTNNPFAEHFPLILIDFPNDQKIEVRPAISLPRISLPSLEFGIESETKEMFKFSSIQPKPEAPWLNRVKGSIQFTENVVDLDSEPVDQSEREDRNRGDDDDEEGNKKKAKSSLIYRSFESEADVENGKLGDLFVTPDEVIKKIQEVCNKD